MCLDALKFPPRSLTVPGMSWVAQVMTEGHGARSNPSKPINLVLANFRHVRHGCLRKTGPAEGLFMASCILDPSQGNPVQHCHFIHNWTHIFRIPVSMVVLH